MGGWAEASWAERARRLRDPYWWLHRVRAPYAALHRQISHPGFDTGPPRIAFLIKLVGRAGAADWKGIANRLQHTLDSIDRQRAPEAATRGFVTFLCGQDLPHGLTCGHDLRFVEAPAGLPRIDGVDRQAKHRIGARAIVDQLGGPAYVVMIDADDIAHPDLAAHILSDNNRRGYLIDDGYMWDIGRPRVARLSAARSGMRFSEMCGSCAVIAVDLSRKRQAKRVLCTMPMNHQIWEQHMAAMGQPLDDVPFPAMLYVVNHPDNASTRFGRDGARGGLFSEHGMEGPPAWAVLREFGVAPR